MQHRCASRLCELSTAVKSVNECAAHRVGEQCVQVEHRLVVTGYSLGATQALLSAMLFCDDAMQQTAANLGLNSTSFVSNTVMIFAMPNAVRSCDTCAYVERATKKLGMTMYAVYDPLDLVEHLCAAVPYIYTVEEDGVYRINTASAVHGALYSVAMKLSWTCFTLGVIWRMTRLMASSHMLLEYRRKLVAVMKLRESTNCHA
jgi:hypothetical protein